MWEVSDRALGVGAALLAPLAMAIGIVIWGECFTWLPLASCALTAFILQTPCGQGTPMP